MKTHKLEQEHFVLKSQSIRGLTQSIKSWRQDMEGIIATQLKEIFQSEIAHFLQQL